MDKDYWKKYYTNDSNTKEIQNASTFAQFCQNKFLKAKNYTILELGSGNGRDAIFFAQNGHQVIAIDQVHAIKDEIENINFLEEDFVQMDYGIHTNVDIIYSRFTLHAIKLPEENIVIEKVFQTLPSKGYFMLEVRSDKDPLCGQGEAVGDNGFITTHYRRFINSNTFIQKMLQKGFILQYFTEEDNLSVFHNDNPYLIRAVFTKN
jgi:cyclopropane fatty-acyl-phospholipid synthase-like methyltransferase